MELPNSKRYIKPNWHGYPLPLRSPLTIKKYFQINYIYNCWHPATGLRMVTLYLPNTGDRKRSDNFNYDEKKKLVYRVCVKSSL